MHTLIHGDDIVESRNFLYQLKSKHKGEIISFDGRVVSLTDLMQSVESTTLFEGDRIVIIESLYSRLSKNELKKIIDYLVGIKTNVNITLWEKRELTTATVKKLSKVFEIELFKLPKIIFTFSDSIKPGNNKIMLTYLQELRKNQEDNFIFLMIVRQIRLLLSVLDDTPATLPYWMVSKFKKQASYFSKEKLIAFYKKLLIIDIGQKTGTSSFSLGQELDLLLATL